MLKQNFFDQVVRYTVVMLCVSWLLVMMQKNEVPPDVGDGIMHFFLSQASWSNPDLFLHHWGKPLYILLSSPWSQFGFNGLVVFNILVYFLTCLFGFKILSRLGIHSWIQALLPPILLLANDVSITILGGLTEPLFNLAVMAAVYFLLNKKFLIFAILVSFMPFLRSEGQLPVLLAALLLVAYREFKVLPFLLSGFVIYALWGVFVYGDPLWYFTMSPYAMANDIYGSGTWDHYLLSYRNYLGNPGLYVFIVGVIGAGYLLLKKQWLDLKFDWAFFVYGIFVGVLVAHSYFWATGQNGSLGLTRITTQGMPAFVVLHLYYLGKLPRFDHWITKSLLAIGVVALLWSVKNNPAFPKFADPLDKQVIAAAKYTKTLDLGAKKIYYHFPLYAFTLGQNPYFNDPLVIFHSFGDLRTDLQSKLKVGDLIVRDSHFGPQEANLPLDELKKFPELVKIKEFISSEQVDDPRGETEGVIVYQYIPVKHQQKIHVSTKTITVNKELILDAQTEFADIHTLIPVLQGNAKVTVSLKCLAGNFKLVYDYNQLEDYGTIDLNEGQSFTNTYYFRAAGSKLYIWNPEKKSGRVRVEQIRVEEEKYHPFLP